MISSLFQIMQAPPIVEVSSLALSGNDESFKAAVVVPSHVPVSPNLPVDDASVSSTSGDLDDSASSSSSSCASINSVDNMLADSCHLPVGELPPELPTPKRTVLHVPFTSPTPRQGALSRTGLSERAHVKNFESMLTKFHTSDLVGGMSLYMVLLFVFFPCSTLFNILLLLIYRVVLQECLFTRLLGTTARKPYDSWLMAKKDKVGVVCHDISSLTGITLWRRLF